MADELFTDLSPSATTNFAELVEQAQGRMLSRSVADVPGSFNKKEVKGLLYWYWQWKDLEGKTRQVYLGPDDERMRELIRRRQAGLASASVRELGPLAGACVALGCMELMPAHFKVIKRLSDHGFFQAGGVLVGTHAFVAMSNMLGVRWTGGWRTNDIDVAHPGKNVSLALPSNLQVNIHDAITSLEMGLLPAKSLLTQQAATYLTPKGDLRVDLLTTAGRTDGVYRHAALNVNLEPLKFMEFSLEKTTQTAVISGEDALVVNIPAPMRYALHKLLVMAEREEKFRMKIAKDAGQVAALVSYGLVRSRSALQQAAADIMKRGKGWRTRVEEGLHHLRAFHPEVADQLTAFLQTSGTSAAPSSPPSAGSRRPSRRPPA